MNIRSFMVLFDFRVVRVAVLLHPRLNDRVALPAARDIGGGGVIQRSYCVLKVNYSLVTFTNVLYILYFLAYVLSFYIMIT